AKKGKPALRFFEVDVFAVPRPSVKATINLGQFGPFQDGKIEEHLSPILPARYGCDVASIGRPARRHKPFRPGERDNFLGVQVEHMNGRGTRSSTFHPGQPTED